MEKGLRRPRLVFKCLCIKCLVTAYFHQITAHLFLSKNMEIQPCSKKNPRGFTLTRISGIIQDAKRPSISSSKRGSRSPKMDICTSLRKAAVARLDVKGSRFIQIGWRCLQGNLFWLSWLSGPVHAVCRVSSWQPAAGRTRKYARVR